MDNNNEVIAEGSIWKKILIAGDSRISQKPSEGSTCLLKIENLERELDKVTDSSKLKEKHEGPDLSEEMKKHYSTILGGDTEVTLIIGEADCEIDKRIERAVQLMKDGECARITVSFKDSAPDTKSYNIIFDATLIKHDRLKPIWEWTPEEKYNTAMRYKNIGVEIFKESERAASRFRTSIFRTPRFVDAFYRFSKACKILITLEPLNDLNLDKELYDNIQALRVKLYNNMAACQAKHQNHYHVIELCSKVLARDDKNVVTLFRRGLAYGELKDYERAVQDLTSVLNINPSHEDANPWLQRYQQDLKQANKHCNEMIKRMFKI